MMDEQLVPVNSSSLGDPSRPGGQRAPASVDRREFLKLAACAGAVLSLDGVVDASAVRAATGNLKLSEVSEFTTACNFCSCGCGMIAATRDGKLLTLEGDYDHVVNGGSLCVKGMALMPTHESPRRNKTPRYRAPGSDHWEDITWDDAIEKIAQRIRKTRDETWISTERVGDEEVPVNRTDAFAFLGGAQNTNEECYIFQKAARLLGTAFVEHQARL